MTEQAIENFLYQTFGYGRVRDFIDSDKSDKSLKSALEGTILSSFGTRASPARDEIDINGESVPAWRNSHITVPHIFSASQLEEQIKAGKRYLDNFLGKNILRPKIQERQFFLSSFTTFVGYTSKEVREVISKVHAEYFPQAEYQFAIKGRYQGFIEEGDFYLFTEGSVSRFGAKLIVASFNLPESVVTELNRISSKYHSSMIHHPDLKRNQRKTLNTS
ncbi:hypothetical protein HZA97_08625 [Candidatus Woesearchaeota archaeon]|nr:hypothetical protein [Candidatus Woesearchaeota archaeon]